MRPRIEGDKYLKGKNYRARMLKSGQWQLEIRSTEYGAKVKRLPVGTKKGDVHKHARNLLTEMANSTVPELAKKALREFTLDQLIEAFKTYNPDLSRRDKENITTFTKHNTALCSKTLDQHYHIKKGIEDYVTRRSKEDIKGYTITRQLSPLRAMYRNAGKKRLYDLLEDSVPLPNPFDEIDLPEDHSGRQQHLRPFQELKIFKAIEEHCNTHLERLKWITLVNMALITCLRRGVLLQLKWRDVEWKERIIKVSK